MGCPVNDSTIIQIGFIVENLEETKQKVAKFLDVPVPETVNSGEYAVTQTVYRGQPAPDAKCYMAFFYFGNLQVEFIQPNEAPSAWREFLETKGEGMHHFAFKAKGMTQYIQQIEEQGYPLLQKGEYRGGNGRYAFLDSVKDLKFFIELLESDEK